MKVVQAAAVFALSCVAAACSKESPSQTAASKIAELNNPASSSDGARIYMTHCSSCHQLDGHGLPGVFPGLAANPLVTGAPRKVVAIVKFGLRGKIRANGETFDGVMPPWQDLLSEDELAAVATYIRFAWHNHAAAVTPGLVEEVTRP